MKALYVFLLFLGLGSCGKESIKSDFDQVNYYHWAQKYDNSKEEQQILDHSKSQKEYVRFFDVQWSHYYNAPIPESVIAFEEYPRDIEIVPTIYITNDVMERLTDANLTDDRFKDLAIRVVKKMDNIADSSEIKINEYQFDCDWTEKTRDSYFSFLNNVNEIVGDKKQTSATIRLHQIKYAHKTGVPPVDKGMLMLYNMGKVNEKSETNSIFNREVAQQYFSGFSDYKLPLNLALPAFSWGVEPSMYSSYVRLIHDLTTRDVNDNKWQKVDDTHFVPKSHFMFREQYVYPSDTIRLEEPNQDDILWAIKVMNKEIVNKAKPSEIVYYQIESSYLQQHYQEKQFNLKP